MEIFVSAGIGTVDTLRIIAAEDLFGQHGDVLDAAAMNLAFQSQRQLADTGNGNHIGIDQLQPQVGNLIGKEY